MAHNTINLTGQRFERLTVICRNGRIGSQAAWLCQCDCGEQVTVRGRNLRDGDTRSCGCLHDERCRERATKHDCYGTREYRSWGAAKTRCSNPKQPNWPNYGGRGITMCQEWRESFEAFLRDMGPCPPGHSIDRIDPDGNYEPGNCRWATRAQQAANKRPRAVVSSQSHEG